MSWLARLEGGAAWSTTHPCHSYAHNSVLTTEVVQADTEPMIPFRSAGRRPRHRRMPGVHVGLPGLPLADRRDLAGPDVSTGEDVTASHATLDAKAGKHPQRLLIHGL
jgi:hypothetical protein